MHKIAIGGGYKYLIFSELAAATTIERRIAA